MAMASLVLSGSITFSKGQMSSFSRQISGSSIVFPIAIPSKQRGKLISLSRSRVCNSLNSNLHYVTETTPAVLTEFLRHEFPQSIPIILAVEASLLVLCLVKRCNPEIGKLVIDAVVKKLADISVVNVVHCLGVLSLFSINFLQLRDLIMALLVPNSPAEKRAIENVPKSSEQVSVSPPPVEEDICKYSKVRCMLSSLGLQSYEENFMKNFLTDDIMYLIKDSDLKEAQIPLGLRVIILDYIKRNKKTQRG